MNNQETNKKFLPLWILKVLYRYSDKYNPLTQEDIMQKLYEDYDIMAERKAIGRNLDRLKAEGYDIIFVKGKGNYINRDFTNGELRFIIDNIIASKYILPNRAADLVERIARLGTPTFNRQIKSLDYSKRQCSEGSNILYWVDMITTAMAENKHISFHYCKFDSSFTRQQSIDPIIVTPLKLMIEDGKYFLIGFENASNRTVAFRLDKICSLKILDLKGEAPSDLSKADNNTNMYDVDLKVDKNLLDDLFDVFGNRIYDHRAAGCEVYIKLKANELEIIQFVIANEAKVKILAPESLKIKMRDIGKSILEHYQNEDEYTSCIEEAMRTGELNVFQVKLKGKIEKEKFDKLQAAHFFCNDLTDIGFIRNYKDITSLAIVENPLVDISPIKELTGLEYLHIQGCTMVKDYSVIYELPNLSDLVLDEQTAEKINLEKLKELNPELNIEIKDDYSVQRIKQIEGYPHNVIHAIFGDGCEISGDKGEIEQTLNILVDHSFTQEERDIFHSLYRIGLSYDTIVKKMGIMPTSVMHAEAAILAKLRHPSSSKKLSKFITFEEH